MKRTPLRRVSKKRAKQLRAYSAVRAEYLERVPLCEVCQTAVATDIHHKEGRIGVLLVDEAKFLATCRNCHMRVHSNPSWARANGYLK